MTLSTDLYVRSTMTPEQVQALWDFQLDMLTEDFDGAPAFDVEPDKIVTACGQGLPAWTWLWRNTDGTPHVTQEQHDAHDDCEPDCDGEWHPAACFVRLDWDTSYGFSDEKHSGCSSLHADYILRTGQWLDAQGLTDWTWKNEFTGEIFERYAGLIEFVDSDNDKQATNLVQTILAALSI